MLTNDQKAFFDAVDEWKHSGESFMLSLAGYAGTGKTWCILELAKRAVENGKWVSIVSPTNQAVKVCEKRCAGQKWARRVNFTTWHSLLGLTMDINIEDGSQVAVKGRADEMRNYDLVIGDESSMVSQKMFRMIAKRAGKWCRVVFSGDPAQLPPVEDNATSPVFTSGLPTCFLTEIVRTDSSRLLDLATDMRQVISGEREKIRPELLEPFVQDQFEWDDELWSAPSNGKNIALAWTNARVTELNNLIRRKRARQWGVKNILPQFVPGHDLVVMQRPYLAGKDVLLHTSERAKVIAGENSATHRGYKSWLLRLRGDHRDVSAYVLDGEDVPQWNRDRREQRNAIKAIRGRAERRDAWNDYWTLVDSFAWVDYAYASTVHKAQGSEYNSVWFDIRSINRALRNRFLEPEERRSILSILYSGFTRAKENLHVLL